MARDDFSSKVVDVVGKRSGCQCSNPGCRRRTVGPSENNLEKHSNIGKAAHITAAASGGPRYNPNLTPAERKVISNAIHLCADCADLIDKNNGIDFPVELLVLWKETNEAEVWNELKNPRSYRGGVKLDKSGLAVLEQWNQSLNEGLYKNRFEIVELFCRCIIPFIQKHPDFQSVVALWRKDYQVQLIKNNELQTQVFEETGVTFRKIVAAVENPTEQIKLKIEDVENILNGKPDREGYSSWPQYRRAYDAVKKLLQMLFAEGKRDLCACYAVFNTRSSYIEKDGKFEEIQEENILEFTFSSTIEEAVAAETEFKELRFQNPVKVWSLFETALYFWNLTETDIKKNLEYLSKVHPIRALEQKAAWFEIDHVKRRDEKSRPPVIFKTELFREGLRTVLNELTLACV